jgi:hypothetical protein
MLMKVATDKQPQNANFSSHLLPVSWRTLHELSVLPDEAFDEAIARGWIKSDMSKEEVKHLKYRVAVLRQLGKRLS